MDKKIFLNSKEIGYVSSNGDVYQNKHGMKEKVGNVGSFMPLRVKDSHGREIAIVEYLNGGYKAYLDEDTEIIIERCSGNLVSLHFGDEVKVENAKTDEVIGVAILISRFKTREIKKENSTSNKSSSSQTRSTSSVRTSSSRSHSSSSSSNTSSSNRQTKKQMSGIFTAVIVFAFIIGIFVTQINSCTPMGKLSGTYSPANEFYYEVDSDIQISGEIYIELKNDGRYHLSYDMSKPTSDRQSIWGDWSESNGLAIFEDGNIVMKSDKSIHVTIRTRYYKDGEYKYQNVTHVLKK